VFNSLSRVIVYFCQQLTGCNKLAIMQEAAHANCKIVRTINKFNKLRTDRAEINLKRFIVRLIYNDPQIITYNAKDLATRIPQQIDSELRN
jgi:hypothetical protein